MRRTSPSSLRRDWRRWLRLALFSAGVVSGCSFPDFAVPPSAVGGLGNEVAGGASTGDSGAAGGGSCDVEPCAACATGTADCNGTLDDGCETTLLTTTDCGACGRACSNEHGTTACIAGASDAVCEPICARSYADCNLDATDGCEASLNTDVLNCGACGRACPSSGGTPVCVAGVCGVSSCNAGFGDCENQGACTFNLMRDPLNCGQCGYVCSAAHGQPSCVAGQCETTCVPGFGDCNGSAENDGCETELNVRDENGNVPNCGACGAVCKRRAYTSINLEQCAAGVCFRDCLAGAQDCGNNRNDPTCVGGSCGCEYSACQ